MRKFLMMIFVNFFSLFAMAKKVIKSECVASYYGIKLDGHKTASGEVFRKDSFTAACNWLNIQTRVRVTNLLNGKSVVVKINDRMGAKGKRLDLSEGAAKILGMIRSGVVKVRVEVL